LYVSNRQTGMMENNQESCQSISSVKLGKYLIDLLTT
jgi:hypothetical protein